MEFSSAYADYNAGASTYTVSMVLKNTGSAAATVDFTTVFFNGKPASAPAFTGFVPTANFASFTMIPGNVTSGLTITMPAGSGSVWQSGMTVEVMFQTAAAKTRMKIVRQLRKECNIMDPDAVKKAIAMHEYVDKEGKTRPWSDGHKAVVVQVYSCFAEMLKITWDAPFYETNKTLPFVPLESEVDCLISGSGKKMATCLQLLKETGMRIGEAWRLKWTDLDVENSTVRCQAEKHGNPRQFKISSKLLAMFNSLPKKSENIFGTESLNGFRWKFDLKKKRLAETQQNPRLLQIKLHTFRHFYATMLYHRTKSILEVKEKLGHRRIESTMVYTHLVNFEIDQYNSAIAKTIAEERALIEDGFEFVRYDERDELAIYRKRK